MTHVLQKSQDDFAKDDFRRAIPRYSHANFPNILRPSAIRARHGATAGQARVGDSAGRGRYPDPGHNKSRDMFCLVLRFSSSSTVRTIRPGTHLSC